MSRGSALQTSASSTPQTSRSGSRRVLKPVTEGAGLQFEPAVGDGHRYTARGGTLRSADRLWPYRAAQNVRPHAAISYAIRCSPSPACWRSASSPATRGTDATLGLAFTQTGWLYPFFATLLGWLGVALTGSDTRSNVLFGSLQKITARAARPQSDPDRDRQQHRRRHGQDDRRPEHRRRFHTHEMVRA